MLQAHARGAHAPPHGTWHGANPRMHRGEAAICAQVSVRVDEAAGTRGAGDWVVPRSVERWRACVQERVRAEAEPVHGSRRQTTTTPCSLLHRCHPPYAVGVGLHGVPAVAPMLMEVDGRWWVTWREGKCCKLTPLEHMHHHMAHGMMPIP